MVKIQRKIEFINDCYAVVDYGELEKAILWYSNKPTVSKKAYIYARKLSGCFNRKRENTYTQIDDDVLVKMQNSQRICGSSY